MPAATMSVNPESTTVQEVVDFIAAHMDDGCYCPCCGRFAKLYKRPLYAAMAAALILIYKKFRDDPPEGGWLHVEQYLKTIPTAPPQLRGDFHKLRFWGFLVRKPISAPANGPSVGLYKITPAGIEFARNMTAVKERVHIYHNEALEFSGEPVNVNHVLMSGGFNYQQLMED